jgi:hypothetical protein
MLETYLAWVLLLVTAAYVGYTVGHFIVGITETEAVGLEARRRATRRGAFLVSVVLFGLVAGYGLLHAIYRLRAIWGPLDIARGVVSLPRPGSELDYVAEIGQNVLEGRVCAMAGEIQGHRCPYVGAGRQLEGGGHDLDLMPWTDARPFLVAGLRTDPVASAAMSALPNVRVVCRLRALAWVRPTELNVWWGGSNPWVQADRPIAVAVVQSCR